MTVPVLLSRQDWGADPVVRSANGTPRPALARPATWLTLHYTGNSLPLTTVDRPAVIAAQQGLERFAQSAAKPNEYNFCLYADAAGRGYVVEYAGAFRGAHSEGENDRAIGVLFWIGVGQAVPDAMVTAYRWLRDVFLAPSGAIGPGTAQVPHKSMPGAATPCPATVMDRWADLMEPYDDDDGGPTVGARQLVRNGDHPTDPGDKRWHAWVVHDAGKYWLPDADALNVARAELGPEVDVSDAWMRAHGPVTGPNPTDNAYGCWSG